MSSDVIKTFSRPRPRPCCGVY